MSDLIKHLRVFEPHPGLFAFYDGRVDGQRFAEGPNWVDDGALSLGIASYALLQGDHALIYDTHVSILHALAVKAALEARGARRFTVVLSHWHLDHVAGTAAFPELMKEFVSVPVLRKLTVRPNITWPITTQA